MVKNTGKPSEKLFDEGFARLGKRCFIFAFTDASEARGTNKRHVTVKAQPSDRIVILDGEISFAEIKSTTHETRFAFSLLRTTQSAYAHMILAAGGRYDVYLHSLHHDQWFRVPYQKIKEIKALGASSILFSALTPWSFPC